MVDSDCHGLLALAGGGSGRGAWLGTFESVPSTGLVESMHSRAGAGAAITSREDSAMTKDRKGAKTTGRGGPAVGDR